MLTRARGINFCPESLCVSLNIQIEQCPGRRYDYRDANNKPVVVIGEAVLYVIVPGQVGIKYLQVLVTKSWSYPYIILGLPVLHKWGIVPRNFPLPPVDCGDVMEISHGDKEAVPVDIGGKEPVFQPPKRRVYKEPDHGNTKAVSLMLSNMRNDILSDFAPAFSDELSPGHVAKIDPITIQLTDPTRKPPNVKIAHSLPYSLLGDTETLISSLVKAGIIEECKETTEFCSSSNFLLKTNGQMSSKITSF